MHPYAAVRSWFSVTSCASILAVVWVGACSSPRPPAEDSRPLSDDPSSTKAKDASAGSKDALEAGVTDAGTQPDGASEEDDASSVSPCLGDEPASPSCPVDGPCAELCRNVVAHFRSGVAHAAASCISALPSCAEDVDVIPCVDRAASRACPIVSSRSYCESFVGRCDPEADDPDGGASITTAGCVTLANALSDVGRDGFAACIEGEIASGTCPTGVVRCSDEIRH